MEIVSIPETIWILLGGRIQTIEILEQSDNKKRNIQSLINASAVPVFSVMRCLVILINILCSLVSSNILKLQAELSS